MSYREKHLMAQNLVFISKHSVAGVLLLLLGVTGCERLGRTPLPAVAVSPTEPGEVTGYSSETAKRAKINSELLREVYLVVFGQEPKNRAEFGNMLDSMNQGASLEGVYNGLTHSAAYRKIEAENPSAAPLAVRVFAEELALLSLELKEPTAFSAESAKPLAMAVAPTSEAQAPSAAEPKSVEKLDAETLAANYEKLFANASIFTLKRILGDEALQVAAEKKANKPELTSWYGKWVARIAGRKVDFGIPQRNLPDETFHAKWAMTASEDQLRWEILNRVHRTLNEMQRRKK